MSDPFANLNGCEDPKKLCRWGLFHYIDTKIKSHAHNVETRGPCKNTLENYKQSITDSFMEIWKNKSPSALKKAAYFFGSTTPKMGPYPAHRNDARTLTQNTVAKTLTDIVQSFATQYNVLACTLGSHHGLIVTTDGLYGFGRNEYGQLGYGSAADVFAPTKIIFFNNKKILDVKASANHTLVLTTDGLYGFGNNKYGQLGFAQEDIIREPKKINLNDDIPLAMATDMDHTLALTTGGLFGFGSNYLGKLGLGQQGEDLKKIIAQPTKINFPKKIPDVQVLALATGTAHSLALTTDGLYGFGSNQLAQLTPGGKVAYFLPEKIERPELSGQKISDVHACGHYTFLITG